MLRRVSGTYLSPACGPAPRASHRLPSRAASAVGRDRVMQNWVLPTSQRPEVPGLGGRRGGGTGQGLSSHLLASMLAKAGVLMAEATEGRKSQLLAPCPGAYQPHAAECQEPQGCARFGPPFSRHSIPIPAWWGGSGVWRHLPPASLLQ